LLELQQWRRTMFAACSLEKVSTVKEQSEKRCALTMLLKVDMLVRNELFENHFTFDKSSSY